MKSVAVVTITLLLAGSAGFAQQPAETTYTPGQFGKPFKKLEKLYEKGNWEALADKSGKLRRGKYPQAAEVDYLYAQAQFRLAGTATTSSRRDQYLGMALRAWSRAVSKDDQGFVLADSLFQRTLSNKIEQLAATYYQDGRTKKAKVLSQGLARYMGDTTELYAVLYPPPAPPVTIAPIEPATPVTVDLSATSNTRLIVPVSAPARSGMVSYASTFQGVPYKWGGESSDGFDCSGFVLHVYRNFGYDFYHNTKEIARLGQEVDKNDMKPGDIACFGYRQGNGNPRVGHVGIIVSITPEEPKVIHAVNSGVQIDSLAKGAYWSDKLLFVRNVVGNGQTNATNPSMYGTRK